MTGDYSLGFISMAGILLLLTLMYFFLFKRMVEYAIMNGIVGLLMKNEDEKE
jgi:LPXTG-motif cell wall-anchored protein